MVFELEIEKVPQILKEIYLFYSNRINNLNHSFNYTENTSLYNFAKYLKENKKNYLSIDWLFDYFNFQFTHWDFIKTSKENQNGIPYTILLHWVLGKKALNNFLNKDNKSTYFYHSNFFPKYKIKKEELLNLLKNKKLLRETESIIIEQDKIIQINPLNENEENIKKRFFNKIEGFYNCLNYTTLFRFNSNYCKECEFKNKCKKQLKLKYPHLYQKRFANKIMLDNKNGK